MPTVVHVRTFPSADRAFAAHVELARQRLERWDCDAVMQSVCAAYPSATATRADASASLDGSEVWYVYRDGSPLPRQADSSADSSAGEVARCVVGPDGRYVDADDAAVDLFGVERDQIVGRLAGQFTRHDGDEGLGQRLLELAGAEPIASTAVVVRPDGEELTVRFSVSARAGGGYEVEMRRAAPGPRANADRDASLTFG